jgi:hypothetical protein
LDGLSSSSLLLFPPRIKSKQIPSNSRQDILGHVSNRPCPITNTGGNSFFIKQQQEEEEEEDVVASLKNSRVEEPKILFVSLTYKDNPSNIVSQIK